MNRSSKLVLTGAASLLGVALAAGGAYAASGSLTVSDAPGQVLKVSGIGPASTHASATAKAHATADAKGIFGTSPSPAAIPKVSSESHQDTSTSTSTTTVAPVAPSSASKDASTVKGNETGIGVSAWAHEKAGVEVVAPDPAVTVGINSRANAHAEH
jgi:hypothetical protein